MKIVKNNMMFLVVAILFFASCIGGENSLITPPLSKETLIGKWQKIAFGKPGGKEQEASACVKKSTIEFKTDGSCELNFYHSDNNKCISNRLKGKWKDNGNNSITITVDGKANKGKGKYYFIQGNLKLVEIDKDGNEQEYFIYKKI